MFTPVIIWNQHHHWASFAKQFGRAEGGHGLTLRYFPEFVAGQIGLLTPLVFILAVAGVMSALTRRRGTDGEARLFLCALIAPLLLYFILHSLHDRVQGNWVAPAYPVLALLAADAAFRIEQFGTRLAPVLAASRRFAVPVGIALAGLVSLQAWAAPIPLNPAMDRTAVFAGWSRLAVGIKQIARRTKTTYVLTSSYALASELTVYAPQLQVVQFNQRMRWASFPAPAPELFDGAGLYIAEAGHDAARELSSKYSVVTWIGEITRTRHDMPVARYIVYRLERPTTAVLDAEDDWTRASSRRTQ